MAGKVLIFDNPNDFLEVMEELNKGYNKPKPGIIYLTKHLDSSQAVRKEITFLKRCKINSFSSFYTSKVVIINLTDYTNCIINVRYSFKGTGYLFIKFRRYFKKNFENVHL